MKMNRKLTWLFLLGFSVLFTQCKDSGKEVKPDDENELITTVSLSFTPQGSTQAIVYKSSDPDGDGGTAPVIPTIMLDGSKTYSLSVTLLDESKTPAVDITKEVAEKAEEHLFVYTPTPSSLLTYTATDKDAHNFPIGLKGNVVTGQAGTGSLKVQLRHQPGSKNGTITPGSDDVNITFPVMIH